MISKQKKLYSLSDCVLNLSRLLPIAIYQGQAIDDKKFNSDVRQLAAALCELKKDSFALYYDQAYPFCVNLFALLHTRKKVLIAANNKMVTAEQLIKQDCILLGDWEGNETALNFQESSDFKLMPLDLNKSTITIFTSGSSGNAKAIEKTLQQFQLEIDVLEKLWGEYLGDALMMATVSHQHIYGLLFRILWPLSTGRCFYSEMFLSPEPLLKVAEGKRCYWVASPAQLKRLDELTPWQQIAKLNVIFSSGGTLPAKAATQIYQHSQHKAIEIYGSSETGGIAWRKSVDDVLWTAFDGIEISVDASGQSYLSSPYILGATLYKMDDNIKLQENSQFELLGRLDRIIKIEEKRLSLDELEIALSRSEWIRQSYSFLMHGKRDKIVAILVLTQSGRQYFEKYGRATLVKQLRKQLMGRFETVVLPKKWLIMAALPMTAQDKINRDLLLQLFSLDPLRTPQILYCDYQEQSVKLQCRISPGLIYFSGHFPQQPVLPGVTQIAWAEQLAKIFFTIKKPFLRMEVIKFKKIIQPEEIVTIKLNWNGDKGKLYFEVDSAAYAHSSGRIVYGEQL